MFDSLKPAERIISVHIKRAIMIAGELLALVGLPPALNLFCIFPFSMLRSDLEIATYGIVSLILVTVTLIAGGVTAYHASQALKDKPSKAIKLPSLFLLVDIFLVLLLLGIIANATELFPGVFIPPLVFSAAALPSLWVISWFIERKENGSLKLTWRRGLAAFAGGISIGLFISIVLQVLLPAMILMLSSNLFANATDRLDTFFRVLGRTQWTSAWNAVLSSPGFIYVLIHFTLIAPLVEEFAKPLAAIPVLRSLDRQETFWVGAVMGAGFAMLENSIYAAIGIRIWVEFIFIRALGSAIQPLGSGIVALGWRDVLRNAPEARRAWWKHYGIAVALHAAWNAASLLAILVIEMLISGNLMRSVGSLGIAAFGMLLLFLLLLGIFALWFGRELGRGRLLPFYEKEEPSDTGPSFANRAMATWALACLLLVVPTGIILTRLWLR